MSPIIAYHATRRACRESILADGLCPSKPTPVQPFGVYVFRDDFAHPTQRSKIWWGYHDIQDVWQVAYIGPIAEDCFVVNGLALLEPVSPEQVTLVHTSHR